jgi:hypothetical protein
MVAMKQWLAYPVLASVVTMILHFVVGLSFGASAFAAFLGWPLVGTLVTADDDLPGGWSNPDGDLTPPWRTTLFWGQMAVGGSVSALVTGFESGVHTRTGVAFSLVGLVCGLLAVALLRHRCRPGHPVQ